MQKLRDMQDGAEGREIEIRCETQKASGNQIICFLYCKHLLLATNSFWPPFLGDPAQHIAILYFLPTPSIVKVPSCDEMEQMGSATRNEGVKKDIQQSK